MIHCPQCDKIYYADDLSSDFFEDGATNNIECECGATLEVVSCVVGFEFDVNVLEDDDVI